MKILSIFVDESGDFGKFNYQPPFYIISMVFHDQSIDIKNNLELLEKELSNIGWREHCVHVGPLIRSEEDYQGYPLKDRQKILMKMMAFVRHLNIKFKTFYIEKNHICDSIKAAGKLSKLLSNFIKENYSFFNDFDVIKVYYDNGQVEVTRILSSVFNALLDNVEFCKVLPADYRLFQVADLICTLKLSALKMERHQLSKSEFYFFNDERALKKNYLKPLFQKEM